MPKDDDPTRAVLAVNLRRLRQAQKLSQDELAKRASMSRVGYRNIEGGDALPRTDTLARLARALDVGLDDLVRPVDMLQSVRFRARRKMTTRETILADVARWLDGYASVEQLLGEQQTYAFASVAKEMKKKRGKNRPIEAAVRAREVVDLEPEENIRDICGLLEDHGVRVFTPAIATDRFFGLSVGPAGGGPAIVVNRWDRITVERWIFTAAHELAHLVLHHAAYDVSRTEENDGEEREADLFASHFLMPEQTFRDEWNEARGLPLIDAVFKLKAIFRVSWKTVVYRLATTTERGERLWPIFYGAYKAEYGRSLSATEEPEGLEPTDFRTPTPPVRAMDEPEQLAAGNFRQDRLTRLVRRALEEEKISRSRAAEILDVSIEEMRKLTEAWWG